MNQIIVDICKKREKDFKVDAINNNGILITDTSLSRR